MPGLGDAKTDNPDVKYEIHFPEFYSAAARKSYLGVLAYVGVPMKYRGMQVASASRPLHPPTVLLCAYFLR
jgi:hypothetical protein